MDTSPKGSEGGIKPVIFNATQMEGWSQAVLALSLIHIFLRAAKAKGYQVYYLSNYSHGNWEIIFERFDFFRLFDGGVVSYQVHQVKPDAEIYQTLLGKYGLAPENTQMCIRDRNKSGHLYASHADVRHEKGRCKKIPTC